MKGEDLLPAAQSAVAVLDKIAEEVSNVPSKHHQQGDSNQGVDDGEQLARVRLGGDVAVAHSGHDGHGEQQRVGEGPVVVPGLHLAVVAVVAGCLHDLGDVLVEVALNLLHEGGLIEPLLRVLVVDQGPEGSGEEVLHLHDLDRHLLLRLPPLLLQRQLHAQVDVGPHHGVTHAQDHHTDLGEGVLEDNLEEVKRLLLLPDFLPHNPIALLSILHLFLLFPRLHRHLVCQASALCGGSVSVCLCG